jgi:hypothetical protein
MLVVLLIRNQIVFSIRTKINNECYDKAMKAIKEGNYTDMNYRSKYDYLGSYESMVFNLTKWTYNQFTKGFKGE